MLNNRIKPKSKGFTLIELMIGVALLAILASVALPSFTSWMRDTQVRNAAESIQNGLQRARSEAVARNSKIEFTLGAGADSSWSIVDILPASGVAPNIDSRSSSEGSKNATFIATPLGATKITFNNFGSVVGNADTTLPFTSIAVSATGSNKTLNVTVGVGGNIRMCDPSFPSSNPRGC